jgi:hypothetical protein
MISFLFYVQDVPVVVEASSVEEAQRAVNVFCPAAVFMGIVAQE